VENNCSKQTRVYRAKSTHDPIRGHYSTLSLSVSRLVEGEHQGVDGVQYIAYCHHYLLTPWSRVFLEKLADSQLVKKVPKFYEARRFITAFATVRHLFLS
jgi:hypothetical protein